LLILALIYLIAGGSLPSGLALCLGYDGHMAIETLGQGGCAPGLENDVSCSGEAVDPCDPCGRCIDIVPYSSSAVFKLTFSSLLVVAYSRIPAGVRDSAIPSFRTIPPDVPLSVPSLVSLRTTVLLI